MEKIRNLNFLDTLLPLAVIVFIICLGVVLLNLQFQKNLSKQRAREDALKNEHQQDLLRAHIEAGEQERKRMAHDLHDELGAVLSMLRMNLVLLEQQDPIGARELTTALQNARKLSETAMTSIRSISHRLMPPQLESFGLIATLESVVSQLTATGQLSIRLTAPSPLGDLPWTSNVGLYRIIMELLNNTIKHAGATEITIAIYRNGAHITCNYADNGRGLPANAPMPGLGLKGIEGRVSALCGRFEMGNAAQNGFYATIQIPAETL
jgi:signal transduction histidine kinase